MNGATTDPLVSTIRPPKIGISTSAGTSQNFLRASMNAAISFRKDIIPSEWLFERFSARASLAARNPERLAPWAPQPHRVDAERPHHQPGRHDCDRIHPAEKDWVGNLVQQQSELYPSAIGALEGI